MEQQNFDSTRKLPDSVQHAIADAMERVDEHADVDWKVVIDRCIIEAARKKAEITSDDVLAEWEAVPNRPQTHNLAAIGPAMKRAAKDGVLTSTNRVVRSAREVKHGIRHTIWISNIYRGKR
jgi:membrane protein involved in colicin uptake